MAARYVPPEGPMPFLGVRVHPSQAELLARFAAAGTSRSSVVREALSRYFDSLDEATAPAHRVARLATESFQTQAKIAAGAARLFTEEADPAAS